MGPLELIRVSPDECRSVEELVGRGSEEAAKEQLLSEQLYRLRERKRLQPFGPMQSCAVAVGWAVGLPAVGCVISLSAALG